MRQLGRSGAKIEILEDRARKEGGFGDLRGQVDHCLQLGTVVCPQIYQVDYLARWYEMERLDPASPRFLIHHLHEAKTLLAKHVWSRPASSFVGWRKHVVDRAARHGVDLRHPMKILYPENEEPAFRMTHGDCTAANFMVRNKKDLVIIDPLPPKASVPSLPELDMADMLQSCAGWEHVLDRESWHEPHYGEASKIVLNGADELTRMRAHFWAAYKCVRIWSHGADAGAFWALDRFDFFMERAQC